MNIDSFSISLNNYTNFYNIIVSLVKNNNFFPKNNCYTIDLLSLLYYINIINNKSYILMFFNFFIKKYIDF